MRERSGARRRKVRGKQANTQFADGLGDVVRETTRLWRKYHLGYYQTKYVVEQVRRRLTLLPPGSRRRTVNRLDKIEVERLIQNIYQSPSKVGLMNRARRDARNRRAPGGGAVSEIRILGSRGRAGARLQRIAAAAASAHHDQCLRRGLVRHRRRSRMVRGAGRGVAALESRGAYQSG
jgi:hypothetical protein